MYDYVKQRHEKIGGEENEGSDEEGEQEESDEDDDDDEEEDQGSQGRPYSFREKRTATRRYSAPPVEGNLYSFLLSKVCMPRFFWQEKISFLEIVDCIGNSFLEDK